MANIYYIFANNIFSKDFEKAFWNLKELIISNKDNKNLLLYALLLEELLKYNNLNFSFINSLNKYSLEKKEGYEVYYQLTFENILKRNYELALKSLKEYKINEKKYCKNNTLDIVLLEILLEEVNNKDYNNKYPLFRQYFQKLQENISEEKYLEAIDDCQLIKEYSTSNKIKKFINIEKLLNKIIDMQKNKTVLRNVSINYADIKDYNFILDDALRREDYQTAYRNIGKVIYYEPNSVILKIYRQLLYKINLLNKINFKESNSLNNKIIFDLIKNKEFKLLKKLLKDNINNDKFFYSSLLQIIDDLENKKYNNIEIKKKENIIINFYQNLDNKNYLKAYEDIDLCLKEKAEDKYLIYKELLKNFISLINNNHYNINYKSFDNTTLSLLRDLIHINDQKDFEVKLDYLKKFLINKSYNLKLSIEEQNILDLITTYFNLKDKDIDFDTYFANISKEDNIIYYFNKAIHFGDYNTVYNLMNSDEWFKNNDKLENIIYYSVIRKILIMLKTKVKNKIDVKNEEVSFNDFSYYDSLGNLKYLIKKRNFKEAYEYLKENDFKDNELYYEILLKLLVNLNETESLKR